MFDNDRYITIGVENEIPIGLQLFMWECIDKLKGGEMELDYLQVFEFEKAMIEDILIQLVKHRQEIPEYKKSYELLLTEIVNARIFIIDDGEHSTMMLAREY